MTKKRSTAAANSNPSNQFGKNGKSGSSTPKPEDLAMAFGGMPGQVYIKNREDDLGWGGSGGKKKGSRAGTGANTPNTMVEGEDGTVMDRSRSLAGNTRGTSAGGNPAVGLSPSGSRSQSPDRKGKKDKLAPAEPERPKSREMKKIERMIEGVKKMANGQAVEAGKMDGQEGCFCMGEFVCDEQSRSKLTLNSFSCQLGHIPCRPIHRRVLNAG
jgi:hypothetical protein